MNITDAAAEMLESLKNGNQSEDNPFIVEEGDLYLYYDSIQLVNANTINPDKKGMLAGFKWRGKIMTFIEIEDTTLSSDMALNLTGMEGRVKMNAES